MKTVTCPVCGESSLVEKRGEYQMNVPPNVPGGAVIVRDAQWRHCEACGEDILSLELEQAINRQCRARKVSGVA